MTEEKKLLSVEIERKENNAHVIKSFLGGQKEAFNEIVIKYSKRIFTFFFIRCQDRGLAEDLTQETFLRVYKSVGSIKNEEVFESWLFRIAGNLFRDWLRTKKKVCSLDKNAMDCLKYESDNDCNKTVIKDEKVSVVRNIICSLPDDLKEIALLRYQEGKSYKEISNILNIPVSSVGEKLHRVRKVVEKEIVKMGVKL